MARVTVEDCVEKIPNRFSLVLLAAHRARAIGAGSVLGVDRDNDKDPVVALREIAEEGVDVPDLRESLIQHLQNEPKTQANEEELDQPARLPQPNVTEDDVLRALQQEAEAQRDDRF